MNKINKKLLEKHKKEFKEGKNIKEQKYLDLFKLQTLNHKAIVNDYPKSIQPKFFESDEAVFLRDENWNGIDFEKMFQLFRLTPKTDQNEIKLRAMLSHLELNYFPVFTHINLNSLITRILVLVFTGVNSESFNGKMNMVLLDVEPSDFDELSSEKVPTSSVADLAKKELREKMKKDDLHCNWQRVTYQ